MSVVSASDHSFFFVIRRGEVNQVQGGQSGSALTLSVWLLLSLRGFLHRFGLTFSRETFGGAILPCYLRSLLSAGSAFLWRHVPGRFLASLFPKLARDLCHCRPHVRRNL